MIKVQSKRDGRFAETDGKIENGFITIIEQDGKKINIAESTFKRYWKKVDSKTSKVSEQKPTVKEEVKNLKKEVIKKQPEKKKVKEEKPKKEKVKTSKLPLRSFYHSIRTSNYKWFFGKFNGFNAEQKKEVVDYLLKEGTEKHKKFLAKNGLIKGGKNEGK